jgi:hypothetical protein
VERLSSAIFCFCPASYRPHMPVGYHHWLTTVTFMPLPAKKINVELNNNQHLTGIKE